MAAAAPQDSTTPKDAVVHRGDPSPTAAAEQATSRHDEFYFTDEMTVFQIENRLFRVHRHFLAENSLIFNSMFSLPRVSKVGSIVEGASDANPIFLSDVTVLEFETLLRFFYKSIYDGFSLPQASWIALLSISHRYEFLNVYERAIREIYGPFEPQTRRASKEEEKEKEDEKEKEKELQVLISVAEKYDVPLRNVVPLLVPFVVRARPLTEGEVLSFSALTVSRLAHAREEFREAKSQSYGLMGSSQAKEIVYRIWQVSNDG